MAEGVRFELTESLMTLNGFRGRRLKPLGHPSGNQFRLVLGLLNNPFETHCQSSSGPNIFRISVEYCPSAS